MDENKSTHFQFIRKDTFLQFIFYSSNKLSVVENTQFSTL